MLGILPFYHIFGMSLGSLLSQEEAKRTRFQAVLCYFLSRLCSGCQS